MESFNPAVMASPPVPDLSLQDEAMRQLYDELLAMAKQEREPIYAPWYDPKDWPTPDTATAWTDATRIWDDFSSLRQRWADDIQAIYGHGAATFVDATPDEKRHALPDMQLKADVELVTNQIAALDHRYQPVANRVADQDEAADKADFLYACDDDDEHAQVVSGHPPFKQELARTMVTYGHIVAQHRLVLNADIGEMPIRGTLIDPMTCAWVIEGDRGICIFVRKYRQTVRETIATFDTDGKLRRKYREGRDPNGTFCTRKQDHEDCEVTEYWDRRWHIVWLDGVALIGPDEHPLGETPYTVQVGARGVPHYISAITPMRVPMEGQAGVYRIASTGSRTALAAKGLSYIHLMRTPQHLREAIMNRALYYFRYNGNPAMLVEQSDIAAEEGVQPLDRQPGQINTAIMGQEKMDVLPGSPDAASLSPVMAFLQQSLDKTAMPLSAYGMNSNSNVSGHAVETLSEHGRDKLTPDVMGIESFLEQVAEKRLRLYANWGFFLKQGDKEPGELTVPRQNPMQGQSALFTLTPRAIRQTGWRVKVKMNSVRISSLPALMAVIGQARGMGLMTRRHALDLMGDLNPDRTIRELDLEAVMGTPDAMEDELLQFAAGQQNMALIQKILELRKQRQPVAPAPALPSGNDLPITSTIGASLPSFGVQQNAPSGPQGPLGPRNPSPFPQ